MTVPQNTIAIVYDYNQTLSPNYMQDEVLFPTFGIDPKKFWAHCHELVKAQGFDNELAYMKALLDYLDIDRPTNARLRELGDGRRYSARAAFHRRKLTLRNSQRETSFTA